MTHIDEAPLIKDFSRLWTDLSEHYVEELGQLAYRPILQQLSRTSQANNTVWKGGTSLSKAYRLIDRFSSDIDVAVLAEGMKGNQIKNLISKVSKGMTEGIPETDVPGETSKGSHYRKTYHSYTSTLSGSDPRMKLLGNYVIVEINSFANPYPYVRLEIESFITQFLRETGRESLIEELDMAPFELNVLDKRRTICEKLVSLLRFSFTSQPLDGLNKKIRHFYDLHALVNDAECREYLSQSFLQDLKDLWQHDQSVFDTPDGWQGKNIDEAPLIKDFSRLWTDLSEHYVEELGQLAYRPKRKARTNCFKFFRGNNKHKYGSVLVRKYRAIIVFHVNVYVLIESDTDEVFIKEFVMVDTCTCDIPFVICVEASNRAIMLTKFLDATHLYFQSIILSIVGKIFQLGY